MMMIIIHPIMKPRQAEAKSLAHQPLRTQGKREKGKVVEVSRTSERGEKDEVRLK